MVAVVAVQGWLAHGWFAGRTRPVRQVRMARRVTRQVLVVSVADARVESWSLPNSTGRVWSIAGEGGAQC